MAFIVGCTSNESELVTLTGSVTYEGKPVADGRISLLPIAPTAGRAMSVPIVDGSYQFTEQNRPHAGEHRVEIEGFRKTGKKSLNLTNPDRTQTGPQTVDETVPYIPPKFNLQSTLQLRLEPGANEKDFDL